MTICAVVRLHAVMLMACALCMPAAFAERCEYRVDTPSRVKFDGASSGYDTFATTTYKVRFDIRVRNESDAVCSGYLSLQREGASPGLSAGAGHALNYRVSVPGQAENLVDIETDTGLPPNTVPFRLQPDSRTHVSLEFAIPQQQVVPSGMYTETLLARIIDGATLSLEAEDSLELAAMVEQQASIMLFDSYSAATGPQGQGTQRRRLDFGTLESGEQRSLTVLVLSNDYYSIFVESKNEGRLVHEIEGSEAIDYKAFLGREEIRLASGDVDLPAQLPTALGGEALPLRVQIGEVGAARAGRYEDVVTISVAPD